MSISSINTNLAALFAQQNIGTATTAVQNETTALSSGNRIVNASTEVAALAAGTALISQVNTLTTALSNASQGSSLLQVADGGLAQIQTILQRQQAIATSAESGSLSSTQRGFLDQEFQALTQEINQLASSTNFNGVNLIDGSISGSNPLQTTSTSGAFVLAGTSTNAVVTAAPTFSASGNDTTFYGPLSGGTFTVSADATTATDFRVTYTINGSAYTGFVAASGTSVALSNGVGTLTFGTIVAPGSVSAANDTVLQQGLAASVAGATAYAVRTILTADATSPTTGAKIANSAIAAASTSGEDSTNGTILAGFTGANVSIQSAQFNGANAPAISNFTATTSGTSVATLSLTLNGQTYTTGALASGGTSAKTAVFGSSSGGIPVFYLNGNTASNEKVTLTFTGLTDTGIDLTTTAGTQAFLAALNTVFGSGGSGLQFQVGSTSSQSIGITIGSATSSSLFAGVAQDVLTQGDATTAGNAVQTALNTVTALRASVGAAEERFNFASNAIQSASQNEGAAKSSLLDTDVAATSTQFATSQVQLQAGIAVLAQANQLQQNLLKLL